MTTIKRGDRVVMYDDPMGRNKRVFQGFGLHGVMVVEDTYDSPQLLGVRDNTGAFVWMSADRFRLHYKTKLSDHL